MSYRREIPKLNRDNFAAWQRLMRLHLRSISNLGCKYLDKEYKTPTRTLSVEDIVEKKNHNVMMINLASALNYAKFDEVKYYQNTFQMWNKLK